MAQTSHLGLTKYGYTAAADVAVLDSNMELIDAAYGEMETAMAGKAAKVASPTAGNLASMDSEGNITNSGKKPGDFAAASQGVYTLTHSKSGTVHTLSGLPTGVTRFTAKFDAAAAVEDGDTWKIGSVTYTAALASGDAVGGGLIAAGAIGVAVEVDTAGHKLGFKAGGGYPGTLPSNPKNLTAKAGNAAITLTMDGYTAETAADLKELLVIVKAGGIPQSNRDGTVVRLTKAQCTADTQITVLLSTAGGVSIVNDTTYYIRLMAVGLRGVPNTNLEGAAVSGTPKAGIPLAELPVGTLVKDTGALYNGKPIFWKIADKNHAGYPSGAVTLITDKIISLKCFDAMESGNGDSTRRTNGNNRYIFSNARQWLNSGAAAGAWYSAQHSADAPPTNANVWSNYNEYDQKPGFLAGFSANMVAALLSTTHTVGKSSTDGGGTETCVDKVFFASCTEVGLSSDHVCGTKLALFSDDASRVAYPTAECVSESEYTGSNLSSSKPWYYWLADAYASNSNSVRGVNSSGALGGDYACRGYGGARPLCNLSSSILVSDTADSDGAYTIVWS